MNGTAEQTTTPAVGTITVTSGPTEDFTPNVSVWLVDDNDQFRSLVAETLGHWDGINCVRHFSSPDNLLSALASKPGPDVILLDVQMGDRNGLDAVRPIKSLARSTRVLMYTTCFDPQWRERALSDGASDYLLKSDPLEKLVARIRCSNHDPAVGSYPRRRSCRTAQRTGQVSKAGSSDENSTGTLGRRLRRLLAFWN